MSVTRIPAALRRLVRQRAEEACDYCLIPETHAFANHEVDHVVPEKHGGTTTSDNLALACALCNQRKGTDLTSLDPVTGALTRIFHPRRDLWSEHFNLASGTIDGLTPIG